MTCADNPELVISRDTFRAGRPFTSALPFSTAPATTFNRRQQFTVFDTSWLALEPPLLPDDFNQRARYAHGRLRLPQPLSTNPHDTVNFEMR